MNNQARRLSLAVFKINEAYYLSEKQRRSSDAELCIMYALDDGHPHSQIEISKNWLVPKTTVSTIVRRWEQEGYIFRKPVPGKRRETYLYLTDAGKAYAKDFLDFVYQAEKEALEQTAEVYSREFIDALEYYGRKLGEAFMAQEQNERKEQE